MTAPDVGVRPEPVPMPVYRSVGTPGWMKIALGVLAAGVVALGVLSIGQLGRIRELEGREMRPVMQDSFPNAAEPGTSDPEATVPADPVQTEPMPEEPTESVPGQTTEPTLSLEEDLKNRLETEGMISEMVKEQLRRIENWNLHAKQWVGSETGPWSQGNLGEHLQSTLENALGNLPQEENPVDAEEEMTDPSETENETEEDEALQDAEG